MSPDDPRHGTYAGACAHKVDGEDLCPPCVEARRRYNRVADKRRKQGHQTMVKIGADNIARLRQARRQGATYQDIADQLGVGIATAHRWVNAKPSSTIPVRYAARLERFTFRQPVTAIGLVRRLQALKWLGYPSSVLADHMGVCAVTVCTALNGSREVWYGRTRDAILATYADLWDKPRWVDPTLQSQARGAATRAHEQAVAAGFVSPMAWDDIDNPREQPRRGAKNAKKTIDPIVVERVLAGEVLPTTKPERDEIMRRWRASGGSERELCIRMGWHDGRYDKTTRPALAEAS